MYVCTYVLCNSAVFTKMPRLSDQGGGAIFLKGTSVLRTDYKFYIYFFFVISSSCIYRVLPISKYYWPENKIVMYLNCICPAFITIICDIPDLIASVQA